MNWFRVLLTAEVVIALTFVGCGAQEDSLPRRAISGKVTLDETPLARGAISFDPADTGQKNAVSVGGIINEGSYSISKAQGPTPGTYRVSIIDASESDVVVGKEAPGAPPKRKASKSAIPAQYNTQSKLKAEITEGGTSSFNFDLTSK